jgi:hypothetical protein
MGLKRGKEDTFAENLQLGESKPYTSSDIIAHNYCVYRFMLFFWPVWEIAAHRRLLRVFRLMHKSFINFFGG